VNTGDFQALSSDVDQLMAETIAQCLAIDIPSELSLHLPERTAERHRAEIRAVLGFREATVADAEALEVWLEQATERGHPAAESQHQLARRSSTGGRYKRPRLRHLDPSFRASQVRNRIPQPLRSYAQFFKPQHTCPQDVVVPEEIHLGDSQWCSREDLEKPR
jgi:Domain of unknown function (DUF4158)